MLIIEKKQIPLLVEEIKKTFDFFDCRKETLPFKKYFFPPVQETFELDSKGKVKTAEASKKFVLFGLGLEDLEALTQLDEIMTKPHKDFFYLQNRNKCTIIGLINENIDSMPGGDVVLQKIDNDHFKVWEGIPKGHNFMKRYKKFFKEEKDKEIKAEPSGQPTWSESMRELLLDSELLARAVEWSHDHKIWDELAEQCLGCGICTYVCPLCYCFSIEDKISLEGKCSRCRKWDACTLPEFSEIAGGHNFRKTLKERYYNWFYHKYVRAYNEYGKSQCVGCERCKRECPAKIDIQVVLKRILEDYKKNNG